jgi:uncharacterized protein
MQLNEVIFSDATPIDGYGPGFFRVGGTAVHSPLIVGPAGATTWQGFSDVAPLVALADHVDVLFIGTGSELAHIPASLRDPLEEAGIGVEIMPSAAACRTYNVLLSEGRRIALAVLTV